MGFRFILFAEKATVLAKQYIRTKSTSIREETQGIELEFVCVENENDKSDCYDDAIIANVSN